MAEPPHPAHDEPLARQQGYYLQLEDWNRATETAQLLAQREAEMPLKRRMRTFLAEARR